MLVRADPTGLVAPIIIIGAVGAVGGAAAGALSAWHNGGNVWQGAGQGAVAGAVTATVGTLAALGAATALGAAGVSGAVAGAAAGVAGGAAGQIATESLFVGLGWKEQIDWWYVALSAATGVGGGAFIRPVPKKGPVEVTHWGAESPWVQAGPASSWNHALAGAPGGSPTTFIVDGSELVSPTGLEFGKGLFGQRILRR